MLRTKPKLPSTVFLAVVLALLTHCASVVEGEIVDDNSNARDLEKNCLNVEPALALEKRACDAQDPDPDGDGICCSFEKYLDSDPFNPDIFVEIDWMPNTVHYNSVSTPASTLGPDGGKRGMYISKNALRLVVEAFAKEGITLHFDIGNYYDPASVAPDPDNYNLGGGNEVQYFHHLGLETVPCDEDALDYITNNTPLLSGGNALNGDTDCGDFTTVQEIKYDLGNFDLNRIWIFHYIVLGDQPDYLGTLGFAETPGNDLMITMGDFGVSDTNALNDVQLDNWMAATIMHELGHNLALTHGGSFEQGSEYYNGKPNYESIMNYSYATYGLASTGSGEVWLAQQDQFYESTGSAPYVNYCAGTPLSQISSFDPLSDEIVLDFSHGENIDIDEREFSEQKGFVPCDLASGNCTPFDHNCNGDIENTEGVNVMPHNVTSYPAGALPNDVYGDILTDHDDWTNMRLSIVGWDDAISKAGGEAGPSDSVWTRCPAGVKGIGIGPAVEREKHTGFPAKGAWD